MSPAKQSFEKLLRQLHRTQRQARLDTQHEPPLAEELRDQMDIHWYQLTDEEQTEMRRLSARLYQEEPYAFLPEVSRRYDPRNALP